MKSDDPVSIEIIGGKTEAWSGGGYARTYKPGTPPDQRGPWRRWVSGEMFHLPAGHFIETNSVDPCATASIVAGGGAVSMCNGDARRDSEAGGGDMITVASEATIDHPTLARFPVMLDHKDQTEQRVKLTVWQTNVTADGSPGVRTEVMIDLQSLADILAHFGLYSLVDMGRPGAKKACREAVRSLLRFTDAEYRIGSTDPLTLMWARHPLDDAPAP